MLRYSILVALACVSLASAQQVTLTPLTSGASDKAGFFLPRVASLSTTKPAGLVKAPSGLTDPSYAVIQLQGKRFIVIVNRSATGAQRIYVDSNGDGDLTNDPTTSCKPMAYGDTGKYNGISGTFTLNLSLGGKTMPLTFGAYVFDPHDKDRPAAIVNSLIWYADYAEQGTLHLGSKDYGALIVDNSPSGNFDAKATTDSPEGGAAVTLIIDRKGNGAFGKARENVYDAAKAFNIDGSSYQITQISADGSSLKLDKAAQPVDEVPLGLGAGDHARTFTAHTTGGTAVSFPSDFKHQIVLLDFWATWCGPCMGEVPNVVEVYKKYHSQGFDILGISLDNEQTALNVGKVTAAKGMSWPQVVDRKFWSAAVAVLYGIESIPHAYLVDGDTGVILAEGDDIRGPALGEAVGAAIANKAKASAGH